VDEAPKRAITWTYLVATPDGFDEQLAAGAPVRQRDR
jgi:hypothetical protein